MVMFIIYRRLNHGGLEFQDSGGIMEVSNIMLAQMLQRLAILSGL